MIFLDSPVSRKATCIPSAAFELLYPHTLSKSVLLFPREETGGIKHVAHYFGAFK
jgi:hypothetical protein